MPSRSGPRMANHPLANGAPTRHRLASVQIPDAPWVELPRPPCATLHHLDFTVSSPRGARRTGSSRVRPRRGRNAQRAVSDKVCSTKRAETQSACDAVISRSSGFYSISVSVRARCCRDSPILSWRCAPSGPILTRSSGKMATTNTVAGADAPQKALLTFPTSPATNGMRCSASSGHCDRVSRLAAFADKSALMEFSTFRARVNSKRDSDSGRSSP